MLEWLAAPPFRLAVSKQSKQRFSEIVPRNPIKRAAFRLLRFMFGETGKVSDWTRGWVCTWKATILLGSHKGESKENGLRAVLLEWEKEKWFDPKCKL